MVEQHRLVAARAVKQLKDVNWMRKSRFLRASASIAGHAQLAATLSGVAFYRALGSREGSNLVVRLPDGGVFPCMTMTKALGQSAARATRQIDMA